MALTGDLGTFNFVDILQIITKDKKSGVLVVDWQDLMVVYYLKDGEMVFARPVDRIFRVYAERNFEQMLSKLRISRDMLPKTLEKFLIPRLANRQGVFSFTPGFIEYSQDMPIKYPIEELIFMASRLLNLEEVERRISDDMLLFERNPDSQEKIERAKLHQEEIHVLNLVNGTNTVRDIRFESKLDRLLVDRTLYGLLAIGALYRKKKERQHKPSITLSLLTKVIERIKGL